MAGPITWRTIYGQTPDAAARLMQTAQSSFNQGFDALGNVLEKEQETNQQNWDNTKKNNTNEYLDKLAQYRSLDELQAAQASGELDRLKQGYGYQIDAGAVRDADNTRVDLLRERATKATEFQNQQLSEQQRPLVNQAYALYAAGDHAGLSQLLKANPDLIAAPELSKMTGDLRHTLFGERMDQGQLAVSQGQLGIAQSRNAREQASFEDERTQKMKLRALDAKVGELLSSTGNLAESRQELVKWAKDNGIPVTMLGAGMDTLTKTYAASTNLTTEQADAIAQDGLLLTATQQAKEAAEMAAKLPAYDPNITAADALEKMYKRVPGEEDDSQDKVNSAVETFIKDRNFKGNIGPVLDLALRSTPKDEALWGDDSLDTNGLVSRLSTAYDQILAKQEADAAAATAKLRAASVQATLERNARNSNRPRPQ